VSPVFVRHHQVMIRRRRQSDLSSDHYHATLSYPGYPDADEDEPFPDLPEALLRAERQAAGLRAHSYLVEETDSGKDEAGLIREYYVGEQDGTPIATIEVSRCREAGHL
jgi:hypothetical protein